MTTGDMDRPGEGERPGAVDDAVWTELVASFHASTADQVGLWPDAENLPGEPDGRGHGAPGTGTPAHPATDAGATAPGTGLGGAASGTETGPAAGAGTPGFHAGTPEVRPRPAAGSPRHGKSRNPADSGGVPGQGQGQGDSGSGLNSGPGANTAPTSPSRVVRPAARPGQEPAPPAPPAVTWTAGPRDWDTAESAEDGYTPPPPPPLPELGMATKAAWIAGLGGPGYLALATILHWETPQWASLLCMLAAVVGFGYLVSRLKDSSDDEDDDPDDYGAVV